MLDAPCELPGGELAGVVARRSGHGDHQGWARHCASLVTVDRTLPGGRLGDVPDVCVVLVGEFGPFGAARSPYHVDRVVRETGGIAGSGLREVYVSALARDGSDVAVLMGGVRGGRGVRRDALPGHIRGEAQAQAHKGGARDDEQGG